jgi:hypothetical protein
VLTARPSLVRIACVVLAAAMLAAFAILSQDPAFDIAEPTTAAAAGAGVLVLAALALVVARTGRRQATTGADGADDEHDLDEREDFSAFIVDQRDHSSSDVDGVAAVEFGAPATVSPVAFDPALLVDDQPAPSTETTVVVEHPLIANNEPDLEPLATGDEPTAETDVDPAPVVVQAPPATHRAVVPVDGPVSASPRADGPYPAALPVAAAAEPIGAPTLADSEALAPSHERALQLHIRALEAALDEQSERLAQSQLHETSQPGRDMERVLLTIGALRDRMQMSPGSEGLLNRVEAAVARLAVTAVSARPALPALIPVERRALTAPTQPAIVAVAAAVAPPEAQAALSVEPLSAVEEVSLTPALVQVSLEPLPAEMGLAPLAATMSEVVPSPLPAQKSLEPLPLEPVEPAHSPPPPFEPSAVTPHIEERVLPVPAPVAAPTTHASRWRRRRAA